MSIHTNDNPAVSVGDLDDARAFDHGAISRFNAWFFDVLKGVINHFAARHKRSAFTGIAALDVVEIGAGAGANAGYLPAGAHLYAIEPSLAMHERLQKSCDAAGIEVTILATGAESIPLPDDSVDEVICSLVLCTVADPQGALAEVRRVLRPGGSFRFVEHVVAPRRGLRRGVQRMIDRPWGWVFEGCDPHRHTIEMIEAAGFASVESERLKLRHSPFWPVNTAVWGIATR